jgi:HTH-type transcriptional regulator/antitoxin HigA
MTRKNDYTPETVSHPGVTLREKLGEIGMSQKEFAVRTGKPERTIVNVINAKSSLTPDMAVRFESVLQIPATFWLKRQQHYDEAIARMRRDELLADASRWAAMFPVRKMASLGWLRLPQHKAEYARLLLEFFSVSSPEAWQGYYMSRKLKVDFRISLAHFSDPHAISAWLRQGELDAKKLGGAPYSRKKFVAALPEIKRVMANHPDDFFWLLQDICLHAGVKVVYTPCLPNAPLHGSTRWLHDDTPLIQLSARYRQNDRFWFTFFHEAGHILLHGTKHVSIESAEGEGGADEKESEADAFAVKWTFSEEEERVVLRYGSLRDDDIIAFATRFGTHPAMIVGRFQHRGTLPYSCGRKFFKPVQLDKLES